VWVICSIFAALWFLSIHLYLPVPVIFVLFGAMLATAALASFRTAEDQFRR